MKHLKLLKDWESFRFPVFEDREEKLFWEIDNRTYNQKLYNNLNNYNEDINLLIDYAKKNWENFTPYEIQKIEELVGMSMSPAGIKTEITPYRQFVFKSEYEFKLYITKVTDEWYYVCFNDILQLYDDKKYTYYQCDQFDGLMDCIKHLKV